MHKDYITENVANRLKMIRKIRGFTLEGLARKIGISRKQVQNYENCDCSISLSKLYQLSEIFNVSVDYFLDGLNQHNNILSDEDMNLITMFHHIPDKVIRDDILNLIKEISKNNITDDQREKSATSSQ